MNQLKQFLALIIVLSIISSCKKDDMNDGAGGYATTGGAIVINEGGFQNNNGSISYVSPEGSVTNNVFAAANNRDLGDVINSYLKVADKGVIVVNNSQKLEIVDAESFSSLSTITQGMSYPRSALAINDSIIYVTNGSSAGNVYVINLNSYNVIDSISVGNGPNELVMLNGHVYVANSGGFGSDNIISVIDTGTRQVVDQITVADNPEALAIDGNGNLWALCVGIQDFSNFPDVTMASPSKLVQIDPTSNAVVKDITIVEKDSVGDVERLAVSINGQTLYYLRDGEIHQLNITATTAGNQALVSGSFYGLDVNPGTGEIWATTNGFTENQEVKVYSTSGSLSATHEVGIGASSSVFNN